MSKVRLTHDELRRRREAIAAIKAAAPADRLAAMKILESQARAARGINRIWVGPRTCPPDSENESP